MKKFNFPLDRVLDWRRSQARMEESKLEQIYGELRRLEIREKSLLEERARSQKHLATIPAASSEELAAFDSFHGHLREECLRLDNQRNECRTRIDAQIQIVTLRRRDVRLLEKLKEKQHGNWTAEFNREIEQQAAEAALAKWSR